MNRTNSNAMVAIGCHSISSHLKSFIYYIGLLLDFDDAVRAKRQLTQQSRSIVLHFSRQNVLEKH